jgi:TFIIF-interacting CTD phosphatase-like protein
MLFIQEVLVSKKAKRGKRGPKKAPSRKKLQPEHVLRNQNKATRTHPHHAMTLVQRTVDAFQWASVRAQRRRK